MGKPRNFQHATVSNIDTADERTCKASVVMEPFTLGNFSHVNSSDRPRSVMGIFEGNIFLEERQKLRKNFCCRN